MASRIEGARSYTGRVTFSAVDLPADSVRNAQIPSSEQVEGDKLQHEHRAVLGQDSATTASSVTRTIHVARFAGTVKELVAGSVAACAGAATIVVDLKKNNVSILSATITLDNANTARIVEAATLNPALIAYVAGDWFELVVTATAGGGTLGTGFFAEAVFTEGSQ